MDGRVRVYIANLPYRASTKSVLLRIISETPDYLTIRISQMPGGPSVRSRTETVARIDLDTMVRTQLARRITFMRCPDCASRMTFYDGHVSTRTRAGVFLACSGCEACHEI